MFTPHARCAGADLRGPFLDRRQGRGAPATAAMTTRLGRTYSRRWLCSRRPLVRRACREIGRAASTAKKGRSADSENSRRVENYDFGPMATTAPGRDRIPTPSSAALDAVPELRAVLPPTAIGKDYPYRGRWSASPLQVPACSFRWAAIWDDRRLGRRCRAQLLRRVLGLDIRRPALKLPGLGRLGVAQASNIRKTNSLA